MTTKQIVLASRPKGIPVLNNFRTENIELPQLQAGEVFLKGMYYSVDPYMGGRINEPGRYLRAMRHDDKWQGTWSVGPHNYLTVAYAKL